MVIIMSCARCGGFQLWSHFANLGTAVGAWAYDGWRCMNCGDVVDSQILENRSMQHQLTYHAHRVRPYGGNIVWLRPSPEDQETSDRFHRSPPNEEHQRRLAR